MTDHTLTEIRDRLFDALDDTRVGMLGVEGSGQHMQPMTHFLDREAEAIYFISAIDTDLAKSVATGAERAHFTIQAKKDVHACMSGPLAQVKDDAKLDELWSPAASMWFDGGKDDPRVVLLRLPLSQAAVWTIDAGSVAFGIEMARGAMGEHQPDVGDHAVINFPMAA